ncbi:hypothetical protein B0F90DRAFT_1667817 [Multifurca ochricompacta]|uniref:Uncharacterized protein n=1 Tax=Multifurca ochricompacta TaxID=376703 RepID=A0AAD4M6S1_9AGAM|nr:hypothetical protein B0F90DRAFT_1667817 [Multifurca ochricompacta]
MSAMRISRKTFHQKQDDFFNVLRTSTREDATKDDYQAVVTHAHYLFPIKSIKSSYSKECLLDYTFAPQSTGADRQSFYNRVLGWAKAKDRSSTDPVVEIKQLDHAFERLREAVNHASKVEPPSLKPQVDIYISFDEAHSLTKPFGGYDFLSPFAELQRARHTLRYNLIWSFFLSTPTTGKITKFSQPRSVGPSNRIGLRNLITPDPYIYIGFDQLMVTWKDPKMWGTCYDYGDQVTRKELIGFAKDKLLCGPGSENLSDAQLYAVLSQRLALDMTLPNTLREIMQDQIANHMRVCISVGEGFESIRGVASFEPILSEAAYRVMNDGHGFSLPVAFEKALSGFCINQGARGKLLVAARFTWARDQAVRRKGDLPDGTLCHFFTVKKLLESLFPESIWKSILKDKPSLCPQKEKANQPLFEKHEHNVLACSYLYGGTDLDVQKVGFIIVQVKNDSNIGQSDFIELFKKMDPFKYNLLGESDKEDGPFLILIICTPIVEWMKFKLLSDGATTLDSNGQPLFTSCNYVCSEVGENILLLVVVDSPDKWKELINKCDWKGFFDIFCSELPASRMDDRRSVFWWNES